MKRLLPPVIGGLHYLALALWLGGSLTLLLVLPQSAGSLFGSPRFVRLGETCGIVMLGMQYLERRRYQTDRQLLLWYSIRQLLTFAALFVLLYNDTLVAHAPKNSLGTALSMQYAIAQAVLLTLAAIMSVWMADLLNSRRDVPPEPIVSQSKPAPPTPPKIAKPRPTRKSR
jgi:hypothetical protein